MGCDIHALIERKQVSRRSDGTVYWEEWLNTGDPDIGRNYEMFAVLAGVRNYDDIKPISGPRGFPNFSGWSGGDGERWMSFQAEGPGRPSYDIVEKAERYGVDGHSHSWLTLAELKAFDVDQSVDDGRLITSRDAGGAVTSLCRATSGEHEGPVGQRKLLRWPGEDEPKSWLRLLRYMESAKWDEQNDEEVRLVFFFDN